MYEILLANFRLLHFVIFYINKLTIIMSIRKVLQPLISVATANLNRNTCSSYIDTAMIIINFVLVKSMDVILNGLSIQAFLTLAGMDPVAEGNHGKNSKERLQEFCVYRVWRYLIIAYIFIFMSVKQSKCVHVLHCDIITIKEDSQFFFLTKYSV